MHLRLVCVPVNACFVSVLCRTVVAVVVGERGEMEDNKKEIFLKEENMKK